MLAVGDEVVLVNWALVPDGTSTDPAGIAARFDAVLAYAVEAAAVARLLLFRQLLLWPPSSLPPRPQCLTRM